MADLQSQLHKATNGQFWWRVASLAKVLASSETYVARADAIYAANLVATEAGELNSRTTHDRVGFSQSQASDGTT